MVARNLDDQYTAFHNPPPLDDSHWSQTSEEGSDIHSPVVYEHGFVPDSARYHNDSMEYRAATGYLLPPPSLLSTNHHGLHVPDGPEHASYQRHSPIAHSPTSLLHDVSPLSKTHFSSYDRIDHSSSSRLHAHKSTLVGQSTIKSAQPSNKSRPPRRSSANGVVACRQCRSRKIRCDSTRPGCENCARRSTQCEYDSVPKRRGPDKKPGTRRRSCKKRPVDESGSPSSRRRRRARSEEESDDEDDDTSKYEDQSLSPIEKSTVLPTVSSLTINTEVPRIGMLNGSSSAVTDSSLSSSHRSPDSRIVQGPSIDYHRRTWWDSLLDSYSHSRAQSLKDISTNLTFLFSTHAFWLPFINASIFLQKLNDPNERAHMQPSLVIATLALATMIKSSELELGASGRERARGLGDLANAELQAALTAGAIDHTLAEAALVLTVFEFCPHPAHSQHRANSHVVFLDSIIRSQSLTFIDADNPGVSTFAPNSVPIVRSASIYATSDKCSCPTPAHSPTANDFFITSQTSLPPWDQSWSPAEAHKEECRRLCWSALSLVAAQSVTFSAFDKEPLDLFLSSPSNFSILFPGEVSSRSPTISREPPQSPKESIWALYCRSMLLWCSCVRQKDEHGDNADFAIDAWQESQAIQDSLDTHACGGNLSLIHACREYLHNSRMSITREFRRLQGVDTGIKNMFNHRHARDWLYYSEQVAKRVRVSITQPGQSPGFAMARNPLEISWFTTQVSICLRLWNFDRSLIEALDVAKLFLLTVDILNNLFPCQGLAIQRDELHEELGEACIYSRVTPPPRPDYLLASPVPGNHHNTYTHHHL